MKELLNLFLAFARIGVCTFGGGYAMLPMLEREVVEKNNWVTKDEILDYFAIGQCTPGVIAVNTATFIGFKLRGALGAIAATLGVITPSIIIIIIIAALLQNVMQYQIVAHAFSGIRIAVTALIAGTVVKLSKGSIKKVWQIALALIAFLLTALLSASPIIIVLCTVAGAVLSLFFIKGKEGDAK